jgi:hypothetical protein
LWEADSSCIDQAAGGGLLRSLCLLQSLARAHSSSNNLGRGACGNNWIWRAPEGHFQELGTFHGTHIVSVVVVVVVVVAGSPVVTVSVDVSTGMLIVLVTIPVSVAVTLEVQVGLAIGHLAAQML